MIVNASKPAPLLSWKKSIAQLGRNTTIATKHALPNMVDNTALLKNNALIIASLILVISRIIVANLSALKAKGTPEGPYRYQESMRTTIREIGGWTLSFAVLRQFQSLIGKALEKGYSIKITDPSKPPGYFSEIRKNTSAFIHRQPLGAQTRWIESAEEGSFKYDETRRLTQSTVKMLHKIPGLAQKDTTTLIKGMHQWAPILIGSIPSIYLAGFVLEALIRDRSDQVISGVSRMFHSPTFNGNTQPLPNNQPVSTPTPNAFMNPFPPTPQNSATGFPGEIPGNFQR